MTDCRRNRVPGGTYFFTVNLYDRRSTLLLKNIDVLREAVGGVKTNAPFHIDAWMVLPDHLHCLWTLPEGDVDFSARWQAIKTAFSKKMPQGEFRSAIRRGTEGNVEFGSGGSGSTPSAMSGITPRIWTVSILAL